MGLTDKFNTKTVAITLVALGLLGGGSAAVLSYFTTVQGSGTVNKAVTSDPANPEVTFSGAAPETFQKPVTLTNQNSDEQVDYTWKVTEDSDSGAKEDRSYIKTGVYEVSSGTIKNPDDSTQVSEDELGSDFTDVHGAVDWSVTPSKDEVTYTITLGDKPSNLGMMFDVSGDGDNEFQVLYDQPADTSTDDSFEVITSSGTKDVDDYVGVSASVEDGSSITDSVTLTVTVDKSKFDKQQVYFGFEGRYDYKDESEDSGDSTNVDRWNKVSGYPDISTGDQLSFGLTSTFSFGDHTTWKQFDVGNLEGQEVALSGGASQTYNFVTKFTETTGSGTYQVTAKAEP